MTPRLLICIPVHNRLEIARECILTVTSSTAAIEDLVVVYDDGSLPSFRGASGWHHMKTQLKNEWMGWEHRLIERGNSVGIEIQRRNHFMEFWQRRDDFTHLYLTDSDAPHDPAWRQELLRIQAKYGGAPICGYETIAHSSLVGNTIEDDPASEVIWRRVAPGISYLLTREHVEKVVAALPSLPEHWAWDWTVPAILGHRFAVTRTSYVDHIGVGGLHHPAGEGYGGGDRATSPTPYLVQKRAEIVAKLQSHA